MTNHSAEGQQQGIDDQTIRRRENSYTQVHQAQVACTRRLASVKARVCGKLIFGPWRLFLGSCAYGFGPWCLDECVDP